MNTKEIKIPLLDKDDIEVKIKQVTKAGALGLIYKTARTDRKYLNAVYGPMNWTSDYKMIKDNLYCGIGVREDSEHAFVWKWDCGIESRSDDDGNEKKGEASDAFKRAGFQWGIGEELYTAPMIWLKVATKQEGSKWVLENKFADYEVSHIKYDDSRAICELTIRNAESKVVVFDWVRDDVEETEGSINQVNKKVEKEKPTAENNKIETKTETTADTKEYSERLPIRVLVNSVGEKIQQMMSKEGSMDKFKQILVKLGAPDFKCKTATEKDFELVNKILDELVSAGY